MQKKQSFYIKFYCIVFSVILASFSFYSISFAETKPPIRINSGAAETQVRKVKLDLSGPLNVRQMKISNNPDFSNSQWETYSTQKTWYLDYGTGSKIVYVRFKDKANTISNDYSDAINLKPPSVFVIFEVNDNKSDTETRYVTVSTTLSKGIESYRLSNQKTFEDVPFKPATNYVEWILTGGKGSKTVYAQFKDASGQTVSFEKKLNYEPSGREIAEGSLVKGQTNTVYYYGYDGKLHPFLNPSIYHSWYLNYDSIVQVTNSKLRQYPIGDSMCVRQGTWLVKFQSLPRVFAVGPGCSLRPIRSETEAYILYGSGWAKKILELSPVYRSLYSSETFDVTDEDEDIIDEDGDGLSSTVENQYGSSDKLEDTDGDKLSDYEEIEYWFTDPADKDSDDDGFLDGNEVLMGFSPTEAKGKLDSIPENTYSYPEGSVVGDAKKRFYYIGNDKLSHYIGTKTTSKAYISNNLQEKFLINSPFTLTLPKSGKGIGTSYTELSRPTNKKASGTVADL